jgi:sec-independent protein translocase protein TatA
MEMYSAPLFGPVGPELLIILAILILLFGASRIPNLANAVGKSLGSFKQGREEIEEELNDIEGTTSATARDDSLEDSENNK